MAIPNGSCTRSRKGVLVLAFALIVASFALFLPSRQVFGESAAGSVNEKQSVFGIRTFEQSIPIEPASSFRLAGQYVVVRSGQGWDAGTQMSILETPSLKKVWSKTGICHFYSLSNGSKPSIVLDEIVAEGTVNVVAYDLDGTQLFSKENVLGSVVPSPNGVYFFTQFSHTSVNRLNVFDRDGNELFSRPGSLGEWYAAAFSDSVIAYVMPTRVTFLDAATGAVASQVDWPTKRTGGYPLAKIATDGGWMLIQTYLSVACFGPDLKLAWQKEVPLPFKDAAFSDDNRYIVIVEGRDRKYRVSLYETADGSEVWSESIESAGRISASEYSGLSFDNDHIVLISPTAFFETGIDDKTESFLFRIDGKSGQLLYRQSINAALFVKQHGGQPATLSASSNQPTTMILEGWSNETNK